MLSDNRIVRLQRLDQQRKQANRRYYEKNREKIKSRSTAWRVRWKPNKKKQTLIQKISGDGGQGIAKTEE
jgi:hypothetical protein